MVLVDKVGGKLYNHYSYAWDSQVSSNAKVLKTIKIVISCVNSGWPLLPQPSEMQFTSWKVLCNMGHIFQAGCVVWAVHVRQRYQPRSLKSLIHQNKLLFVIQSFFTKTSCILLKVECLKVRSQLFHYMQMPYVLQR